MSNNILICTVGLPRSGKSTWSRRESKARGCPIVAPDAIRLAIHNQPFLSQTEPLVWAIAELMVRALFRAGHPLVIVDDCNISKASRTRWMKSDWDTFWKVFGTSEQDCLKRAQHDSQLQLVIRGMARAYETISGDEKPWDDQATSLLRERLGNE